MTLLSGRTSRSTSGDTGSLKVSTICAGGAGMTAPSGGSLETMVACARAGATLASRAVRRCGRKDDAPAHVQVYLFGSSFTPGAGSL